jgi:hypothetical protein
MVDGAEGASYKTLKKPSRMQVMFLVCVAYYLLFVILPIAVLRDTEYVVNMIHPLAMMCLPAVGAFMLGRFAHMAMFTLVHAVGSVAVFYVQAVRMVDVPAAAGVSIAYALLFGGLGLSVNAAGRLLGKLGRGKGLGLELKQTGAMLGLSFVFLLVMLGYYQLSFYYLYNDFLGNDFGVMINTLIIILTCILPCVIIPA